MWPAGKPPVQLAEVAPGAHFATVALLQLPSSFLTLFLARGSVLVFSDSPSLSGLYLSGPEKCKHRGFHGALPWVELAWGLLKSWLEGAVRTFGKLDSGSLIVRTL